jgi:hypothetical protein
MVILGAPAAMSQPAEVAAFESAYESCATIAARRYASGIDAADLIAGAALDRCKSQRMSYAQALQRAGGNSTLVLNMVEQIDNALIRKKHGPEARVRECFPDGGNHFGRAADLAQKKDYARCGLFFPRIADF